MIRLLGQQIEVIQRFYSNPTDVTSQLRCVHFVQDTLSHLSCDCTRMYTCGCVKKLRCGRCGIAVCYCSAKTIAYEAFFEVRCAEQKDCENGRLNDDYSPNVKEYRLSTRASASLAKNAAMLLCQNKCVNDSDDGSCNKVIANCQTPHVYVSCSTTDVLDIMQRWWIPYKHILDLSLACNILWIFQMSVAFERSLSAININDYNKQQHDEVTAETRGRVDFLQKCFPRLRIVTQCVRWMLRVTNPIIVARRKLSILYYVVRFTKNLLSGHQQRRHLELVRHNAQSKLAILYHIARFTHCLLTGRKQRQNLALARHAANVCMRLEQRKRVQNAQHNWIVLRAVIGRFIARIRVLVLQKRRAKQRLRVQLCSEIHQHHRYLLAIARKERENQKRIVRYQAKWQPKIENIVRYWCVITRRALLITKLRENKRFCVGLHNYKQRHRLAMHRRIVNYWSYLGRRRRVTRLFAFYWKQRLMARVHKKREIQKLFFSTTCPEGRKTVMTLRLTLTMLHQLARIMQQCFDYFITLAFEEVYETIEHYGEAMKIVIQPFEYLPPSDDDRERSIGERLAEICSHLSNPEFTVLIEEFVRTPMLESFVGTLPVFRHATVICGELQVLLPLIHDSVLKQEVYIGTELVNTHEKIEQGIVHEFFLTHKPLTLLWTIPREILYEVVREYLKSKNKSEHDLIDMLSSVQFQTLLQEQKCSPSQLSAVFGNLPLSMFWNSQTSNYCNLTPTKKELKRQKKKDGKKTQTKQTTATKNLLLKKLLFF